MNIFNLSPWQQRGVNPATRSVPLLDLHRQYAYLRNEILPAIARVCDSQKFILGEEVEALENEISALTGTVAAVGSSSGTDALWLALLAAGIGPGDGVITTPFTFFASASAIARVGARPVFADVDPRTLNIDPSSVRFKMGGSGSGKLKAILPVHLYGQCADMTALRGLAGEFHLSIIEDAAQALGAAWGGQAAGSFGAVAAFSFYPTKNLSAFGDAGMVTTNDGEFAAHMRRLRNHGSSRRYHHEEIGWNTRMDAIQAAVLRVKLPHIGEWNRLRREHAETYGRLLGEAGLLGAGESCRPVQLLEVLPPANHVFHQYVIRVGQRDDLRAFLAQKNVGTEIYYPVPLHLQDCFAYLGHRDGDFPVAEQAAREVLALPMFPELAEDEQRYVVACIAEFYSQRREKAGLP